MIERQVQRVSLRLEFDNGIEDGKQKLISKSFNRFKKEVEDENLHGFASDLSSLQDRDVINIKKVEEVYLIER